MKKIITIATAGVFLLGLQGASFAQKEEKAPAPPPMIEKQAPAAPKAETPPAAKTPEMKPAKAKHKAKHKAKSKTKAKKKSKKKKHRSKKAKKKKAPAQ